MWGKWTRNPVFRVGRRVLQIVSEDADQLSPVEQGSHPATWYCFITITSRRPSPGYSPSPPSVHIPSPLSVLHPSLSSQEAAPHLALPHSLQGVTWRQSQGRGGRGQGDSSPKWHVLVAFLGGSSSALGVVSASQTRGLGPPSP